MAAWPGSVVRLPLKGLLSPLPKVISPLVLAQTPPKPLYVVP